MSSQYIFTMHRLSKVFPPDKTVLENITLAFFPGAKIGVLGYNGAGKSTLLRIMAGAVVAEHADLRARIERERDVVEHRLVGRVQLRQPVHRKDVLRGHRQPG